MTNAALKVCRASAQRMRRTRGGLTRTEVAVLLGCLFLLIALAVPGIFHQRESQRNVACQTRMTDLSRAFDAYTTDHNGRFPPLVGQDSPWTADILPYLQSAAQIPGQLKSAPLDEQAPATIPAFLCPNGRQYEPGRNCYIVNGGWGDFEVDPETEFVTETKPHTVELDWDRDGTVADQEREWTRATGVIWRAAASWSLEEISATLDGSSNTILLSETQNSRSWMSTETFDLAFVVGRDHIEFGDFPNPFRVNTGSLGPYAVNSSRERRLGRCPAPSSLHADGVNVLFADGAVRTLSDKIDPLLYLRLMTPDGNRYGEFQPFDFDEPRKANEKSR